MGTGPLGQRERAHEGVGRREPVRPLDGQHDRGGEDRVAERGAQHERVVDVAATRQHVDAVPEHVGGRRRQDAPEELAAEQRGPVRPGVRGLGLDEDAGLADRRQQGRQVGTTELGEELGRQVRQVGDERQQVPLRRQGAAEDLLGEVVEQHGVRRQEHVDERTPVERTAARHGLDGQLHGERPAAGRPHDLQDRRPTRAVEAEPVDVGGADGEVDGREPGHVAGRPQAGDAQRRCPAARQYEVQARREVEDQGLEELLQRVARRDVGVVDDEDGVLVDRRRGRGADVGGERGGLVGVVRRVGSVAGRQQLDVDAGRPAGQSVEQLARQRERRPAGRRAGHLDGRCARHELPHHRRLAPTRRRDHERQAMREDEARPRVKPGIDIPGVGHRPRHYASPPPPAAGTWTLAPQRAHTTVESSVPGGPPDCWRADVPLFRPACADETTGKFPLT